MTDLLDRLARLPPRTRSLLLAKLPAETRILLEQELRADRPPEPGLRPRPRDGGPLPLSFAQQRLWFIDQLEPGRSTYNMPYALRVSGGLDLPAVERALGALLHRHESLRTRFPLRGGEPVQLVEPPRPARLPLVDLGGAGERAREAELARLSAEEAGRPFDLAAGPLLRAAVVRLGPADAALLFTMHHVVSDAWSMGILVREFSALYDAFSRGEESRLAPLPVQYADYALWQREWLGGETLAREVAYWRERLSGAPALIELPTDRPRPPAPSGAGADRGFTVGAETAAKLAALAREEEATPFMALLAAWQWVLARYCGRDDVVVGTPVAGRSHVETEGLIGFFVNTLVLRARVSGAESFRELLRRVRQTTLEAYSHQDLPFEKLVEELGTERSLAYSPVFQVMFSLQNTGAWKLELGGAGLRGTGAAATTAKFDLELDLAETAGGIRGVLTYSTDLWEAGTMERLLEHFRRVLEAVASGPDRRLRELSLPLGAEEVRAAQGSGAGAAESPPRCLHELFAEQAARAPEAPAVACDGRALTYGELERRANRLARLLRRRGAGPEARVGICLERSPELLVGILATLEAGAACVPLDPDDPPERLARMLAGSGASVLLTQERLRASLPAFGGGIVLLDGDRAELEDGSAEAPAAAAAPENLAYVVHTSGSTGLPRGVAVEHGAAAEHLAGFARELGLGPADRVLHFAPVGFDVSVEELLLPLLSGGTAVMRGPEPWSPAEWPARVRELGITVANLPPAYWQEVIESAPPGGLPGLRLLLVGADAVPSAAVNRWRGAFPGPARLLNAYGPTEAVVTATTFTLPPAYPAGHPGSTVPIGAPLPGRTAYVLDRDGYPAPPGAPGELHLGGPLLARGYLAGPEATAAGFVPDPYGAVPGGRLYRTGDRVRRLASGELEFLGRTDAQVKVRGFRIEPGEIEAVLLLHGGVSACAVVAREDAPGEKRLAAYVVPAGTGVSVPALRAHLEERLPRHMVPSALVLLDALPLTASGKLDRRALPAPGRTGGLVGPVAPRTPAEEILAGIWAEVLGIPGADAADDFFELGGHSLLATRVVSRVRQAFGVELPVRALFEWPTAGELAGRVEALLRDGAGPQAPPIARADRERSGGLPLSFAQQRLWLVDRLQPGRAAYNMPSPVRVRGPLDLRALRRALTAVVARHEPLRTRFPLRGGEPVQQVDPARPARLPVADLGRLGRAAREAEAARLARDEARRPFDLAAGPLLRAAVVRLGDADSALLFTTHHIVSDGWSMGIFVRELSALYGAAVEGGEARLPPLPVQYADFAAWQRGWLAGETLERETAYWRGRLSGAPALLELPLDRPRPRVAGDAAAVRAFAAGADVTAGLRALARAEGATLFMTLLAAWQLLLGRYARRDDVVVGTPIAGRNRLETEGLIGFFVNTLVLRADLASDPAFRELLGRVRETTLGAYQHQDLPFEKLVEELGVERSLAHTPLFQVMFALQNNPPGELRLGGAVVEGIAGGSGSAKFDLSLGLAEADDRILGGLTYRRELWDDGSMGRLLEHFGRVLAEVAARPELRVSEVPLLGAAEQAQLLAASRAPGLPAPERCVHELFEQRAARSPEAVALVLDGRTLAYGELDRAANRLARHLRRRGVGAEVHVALAVERSFEMVVGVLAILKAGGVHVPLDPAYPAERLAFQMADSGAALLVTTAPLLERLGAVPAGPVLLDAHREAIARESDAPPPPAATPENLAYVTYTSGSTGRPKGVMARHGAVAGYLATLAGEYGLGPGEVVLQLATLAFDASVRDLLGPLCAGARVVLVRSHEVADPARLLHHLREQRVGAVLAIVPSLLRPLLAAAEEAGPVPLRLLLVSGEPLALADCRRARAAFGDGVRVVNLWGATECTMSSSFHTVGAEEHGEVAPLGAPIPGAAVYVLDAGMAPVPPGVAGEAYIAGTGVARGYHDRPALTAERFLPDPFAGHGTAGARLYRVGDLVRRRPDGVLEFLGRVDRQVKVRGIRVETGEVEAVLHAHPGVRGAAVLARTTPAGETGLVAYVACDEGAPGMGELRSAAERTLPAHMVPSVFVRLDALPLLPNGKTDRAALPEPGGERGDGPAYRAPVDEAERALAAMWESLLGVRPVGLDDDFFRLGGHSMLAVRLAVRVRERFGVELPPSALFEHPTLGSLAARLGRGTGAGPWSPLVAIQPRGGRVPLFFVHPVGGQVLCYSDLARELGPDQPFYGLQAADLARLGDEEASIEEMAARYVAAVRAVRPRGPYLLGGWSFGGFVAFEMAQQLTRAGEAVPLVAMLDTRPPGAERRPADLDECVHLAGLARAEALMAGREVALTADDLRPLDPDARVVRTLEALREAGVSAAGVDPGWIRSVLRGTEVRMRSVFRYRPRPYPGRIAMFVPAGQYADPELRDLRGGASSTGWAAYTAQPLVEQVVPGYHGDMAAGPHAAGLARRLRALIDETLSAGAASPAP